jgi:cell division protein FtsB
VTRLRVVIVILLLALLFAVQGGEYSSWDYWTLLRLEREERTRIAERGREVDSLKREAIAVENDPAVQERLARELYGMLRPGEFLYNILWDQKAKNER